MRAQGAVVLGRCSGGPQSGPVRCNGPLVPSSCAPCTHTHPRPPPAGWPHPSTLRSALWTPTRRAGTAPRPPGQPRHEGQREHAKTRVWDEGPPSLARPPFLCCTPTHPRPPPAGWPHTSTPRSVLWTPTGRAGTAPGPPGLPGHAGQREHAKVGKEGPPSLSRLPVSCCRMEGRLSARRVTVPTRGRLYSACSKLPHATH